MNNAQISVDSVINSLTRQISEQAKKIAVLEATIEVLESKLQEPATQTS